VVTGTHKHGPLQ
jgi:hypothetical protein